MTTLQLQQNLIVAYDRAITGLRGMITSRGIDPLIVALPVYATDGVEGAIRRRKHVHDALYRQFSNLRKESTR